jgi:hypothetical protein
MDSKPWYYSKTLWFNVVVLIGTFLVDPSNELEKLGFSGMWAERAVAVGNMLLRIASTAQLVFQRTA